MFSGVVMKNTYRIAEISFGQSNLDNIFHFEYLGQKFEVQRFGANYSVEAMQSLIGKLQSEVDAFAITYLPRGICLGGRSYVHRQYFEVMNTPSSAPLCDGTGLREICNLQSIIEMCNNGTFKTEDGFYFPMALLNTEISEYLRHRDSSSVSFGDLYSLTGFPMVVKPFPGLMSFTKIGLNLATARGVKNQATSKGGSFREMGLELIGQQITNSKYIVADLPFISHMGENLDFLKGKELIKWSLHPVLEEKINKFEVKKVHNLLPKKFQFSTYMNYALLEAVLRLCHKKASSLSFQEWQNLLEVPGDVMQIIKTYSLPRKTSLQVKVAKTYHKMKDILTDNKPPDFAFIVHALSHRDLEKVPFLSPLTKMLPEKMNDGFDRIVSRTPALVYGHVKNVISQSSGREVNGIVYALLSTPKVLKTQDPEITYQQILNCSEDATRRGAKIIGLGAYTKIVGDSGVTINKNSPIPVTTGNSLSASATLWGLYDAVLKMQLLNKDPNDGKIIGSAMIIGATGSIGKVSAKLLSLVLKKLYLVAPRMDRLKELALEIKLENPNCEIICTTQANDFASEADILVTATSAMGEKIVDVMRLKPGCVVCDCSRPLDFTIEDAQKRPDVLIIESGELILPGPYELTCDLGLPGKTVYACLAETCVLALEEKYESFTLGRDIDWVKVKEIYKMSKKHGVKLAAPQGHMGTITDREIMLTRQLALSRRSQ